MHMTHSAKNQTYRLLADQTYRIIMDSYQITNDMKVVVTLFFWEAARILSQLLTLAEETHMLPATCSMP